MAQAEESVRPIPERPSRVWLTKWQEVSWGCLPTMLLVLILVMLSTRELVDLSPVTRKLDNLDAKLQRLEQTLQRLDQKLDQLDKKAKP